MKFEHAFEVAFGDADPAGIAYYPRILDSCHRVFERFFAEAVGEPYASVYNVKNVGFPTIQLDAEFRAPMRFGDAVTATLTVDRISARTVTFRYEFQRADGVICAVIRNTAVAVDRPSFRSIEIPDAYAAVFRKYAPAGARP